MFVFVSCIALHDLDGNTGIAKIALVALQHAFEREFVRTLCVVLDGSAEFCARDSPTSACLEDEHQTHQAFGAVRRTC